MPRYSRDLAWTRSAHCRSIVDSLDVECYGVSNSCIYLSATTYRVIRILDASQSRAITLIEVWEGRLIEIRCPVNGESMSIGTAFDYYGRHKHEPVNRSVRAGRMRYYKLVIVYSPSRCRDDNEPYDSYDGKMALWNLHLESLGLVRYSVYVRCGGEGDEHHPYLQ
jgi:hypothetical protein